MFTKGKRLTILSEAEQFALYGLPDFDDTQRMEYFVFTEHELSLALSRPSLPAQVYCALQIGYFKAKQAFFRFDWEKVDEEDIRFILERYFGGQEFIKYPVTKHEHYTQRPEIVSLFGYRLWSQDFIQDLKRFSAQVALRDVTPSFMVSELIAFLKEQRMVRPGYTTLQTIISEVLVDERKRLGRILNEMLDDSAKEALQRLLVREDTLSELAAIKQDAKHFGYRMMALERQKRLILEPLYQLAAELLPKLAISRQNLNYYASLAHYYSIYDLRRLKPEQTHLYLLCYAWQRCQQLTDNLVEAFAYHMKQLEDENKTKADKRFSQHQMRREQESPYIGRLLLLYVDENLSDGVPFGEIRKRAFALMPEESVRAAGLQFCEKAVSQLSFRWEAVDQLAGRCKKQLRPLFMALDFSSTMPHSPWIEALNWLKSVFSSRQRKLLLCDCPMRTIPKSLRHSLLAIDQDGTATDLCADRYEFWVYRQVRKRLNAGELYLKDSIKYRCFKDELVSLDEKTAILKQLDIPWLNEPLDASLNNLFKELHSRWRSLNADLRQGRLKHLEFDSGSKTLTWHKPKADPMDAIQSGFYDKLPNSDIADVFRFVNEKSGFLSALTPLQPRYAKQLADEDHLMAVIIAQAMNHGNLKMAETSDIPYHVLETTHQQYLRLSTLEAANDRISNQIAQLSIFPYYAFDLEVLYGSVDGQKFEVSDPTIKARHSRKYFGRGKGVVAYTLLGPVNTNVLMRYFSHEKHYQRAV